MGSPALYTEALGRLMHDLLFLAQRIPYPPNKGDKIRSYHLLRGLARTYRLHLGCFVDDPADWPHVERLAPLVASHCVLPLDRRRAQLRGLSGLLSGQPLSLPYYRDRRMARWVDGVMERTRPRAAFLFSSQMAQYVVRGRRPERLVMDFVDVDSQKWVQYAARQHGLQSWVYDREGRRLLDFERAVAGLADASLFVSPAERDVFRSLAPEHAARVHALENGVDTDYFSPEGAYPCPFADGGAVAVFTGAMDYWPNIEAAIWFATRVLPLLRKRLAGLRFAIVGSNPAPQVTELAGESGIIVTGRVPDVRPYLAHATVAVAPVLTARGVQNKVLEGMAMARPVVATGAAHEGIDALPGRDLLVADGAEGFAAAVLQAISKAGTTEMGAMARRRVVEAYSWERRFAALEGFLE
jgi:polysaccharide biosynthesis protein PslH